MKMCHTEVMKLIKELETQKCALIEQEDANSVVSYKEGETPMDTGYRYEETRAAVQALDDRVRSLRVLLAAANVSVKVEPFGVTIGEALVLLAQLQNARAQVDSLASRRPRCRRLTSNGVVEFTECAYDVSRAVADSKQLREKISALQIAIDRANLTNYVEV